MIVSLRIYSSKACSSQSVYLQSKSIFFFIIRGHKDIGFLSNSDLISDSSDDSLILQAVQGNVIVTRVSQSITIESLSSFICNQFVSTQILKYLWNTSVSDGRNRSDKSSWNEFMILHSHLDCCQNSEVLPLKVPQECHVQLNHDDVVEQMLTFSFSRQNTKRGFSVVVDKNKQRHLKKPRRIFKDYKRESSRVLADLMEGLDPFFHTWCTILKMLLLKTVYLWVFEEETPSRDSREAELLKWILFLVEI